MKARERKQTELKGRQGNIDQNITKKGKGTVGTGIERKGTEQNGNEQNGTEQKGRQGEEKKNFF